jgi:3-hydroxyisobutyrate dehydrogenase-like beta-hydroxyacid dehydrogenase
VKIAFLGLGNMGTPMAHNLMRAGHEVTVFNRTAAKAAALVDAGARLARTAAEALGGAEVAVTMLANDQALREALLDDASIDALPRGAIHMGCSTISVAFSKRLESEHARRGQGYVASPVLGRPNVAAEGKLLILAAGPGDELQRCRPLMEALSRKIFVMGEQPWQATVTKIAANFMAASVVETLGEAFALVRKSGIDPHAFLEAMNPLFGSPIYSGYGQIIADRQFQPPGFRLILGLKDVNLALEAGQDAAVPLPLGNVIRDHLLSAIAHGRENADWSALTEEIARNAGLEDQ